MIGSKERKTSDCIRCGKRVRKAKAIPMELNGALPTSTWNKLSEELEKDPQDTLTKIRTEIRLCKDCRPLITKHLTLLIEGYQSEIKWDIAPVKEKKKGKKFK